MMQIRLMPPEEVKVRYGTNIRFDRIFEIRCDDVFYEGEYEKIGDWCIENFQDNFVYIAMSSRIVAGGYGSRGVRTLEDLKTMWRPGEDSENLMAINRMELRCCEDDAVLFKLRWCHAEV